MANGRGGKREGAGRKKGVTTSLASIIRGHAEKAIKNLDKTDKNLAKLIEQALTDNVVTALQAIGRFIPKELINEDGEPVNPNEFAQPDAVNRLLELFELAREAGSIGDTKK